MINTYHTSLPPPPPPPVPPRMGHGRPEPSKSHHHHTALLWLLCVVLALHLLLSGAGFVYLFNRGNQASLLQGEFHEKYLDDFLILKRIQKCDDNTLDDQSLLDCKRLLDTFRNVMAKASQTEGRVSMLTAEQFHGALAHMKVSTTTKGKACTGGKDKNTCVLEWNDHSNLVHVETKGGSRLTIQHPGYYYVYSQVTFSRGNSKEVLRNIIRHTKWKQSTNRGFPQEEIDEILASAYCSPNTVPMCTISTGGVFKLEKDEELYVSVNNLDWVNYDSNTTFFGLYKL